MRPTGGEINIVPILVNTINNSIITFANEERINKRPGSDVGSQGPSRRRKMFFMC